MLTCYKIRDKNTGLFSRGGAFPTWTKHGKIWKRKRDLTNHLVWYKQNRDYIPQNWEIVEYKIEELENVSIENYIDRSTSENLKGE